MSNRKDFYKIKFTPYRQSLGKIMFRQTEKLKGFSADGRYRFYIDEDIDDPDFWVIQGKGIRKAESCNIAPQNTILLTTEPSSVLKYPKQYTKQFGMVHSCQEELKHTNRVLGPAILPWFVGYTEINGQCNYTLDYDTLISSPTPPKTKLISVITSNKAFTQGHIDRIKFVEKLKMLYGDKLDVFGRGFNEFDDKWKVLSPYKYHIVIENSSQPYYWTEKISDCFLAETFPFYYGCTNLSDYFPKDSFQPIDIYNFDATVNSINRLINNDIYEKSRNTLRECKNQILDEYNMFNYVATLCDRLNPSLPKSKRKVTLQPCHTMQDWHNVYNYTIKRNLFKWKQKIKNVFGDTTILTK